MNQETKVGSSLTLALLIALSVPVAHAELVLDPKQPEVVVAEKKPETSSQKQAVSDKQAISDKKMNANESREGSSSLKGGTTITNSTVTINASPMEMMEERTPAIVEQIPMVQEVQATVQSQETSAQTQNLLLTQADRLRKERVRQELKNEDLLQQKIEQERLRQEFDRTDMILNSDSPVGLPSKAERVLHASDQSPIVESTHQEGAKTLKEQMAADQVQLEKDDILGSFVTLRPKVGMAFYQAAGPFNVESRGSFGVEVGLEFTRNLSFDVGYSFNKYGIQSPNNFSGQSLWYGAWNNQFYGQNGRGGSQRDTLRMNQNVFEAGMRFNVAPRTSRLRPYVVGGGAYTYSFVNYPEEFRRQAQYFTYFRDDWDQDYQISTFSAYAGVGLDVSLGSAVSVGVQGKYYHPLSTDERGYINGYAFYYPSAGYQGLWNYGNSYWGNNQGAYGEKQQVADQLGYSGFYSMQFLMTFNF